MFQHRDTETEFFCFLCCSECLTEMPLATLSSVGRMAFKLSVVMPFCRSFVYMTPLCFFCDIKMRKKEIGDSPAPHYKRAGLDKCKPSVMKNKKVFSPNQHVPSHFCNAAGQRK